MKIQIIVDNYTQKSNLLTDWGLSCLIDNWLLFDTGWHFEIFSQNWQNLNCKYKKLKQIVISHEHYDHTGGLISILQQYPQLIVRLCRSTSEEFLRELESYAKSIRFSDGNFDITKNRIYQRKSDYIWHTEEFNFIYKNNPMSEQGLIFKTDKGYSLLCGCSHPGIIKMINSVKTNLKIEEFYLVAGGFHLKDTDEKTIKEIVYEFKSLNVKKVAASHCTGEKAMKVFKDVYKENCLNMGSGNILNI